MASMVSKACSSNSGHVPPSLSVQEKKSRNKRKFRADPPLADPSKVRHPLPNGACHGYEFSTEKFELNTSPGHTNGCDMCSFGQGNSDSLKLDIGLSCPLGSSEVGPSRGRVEVEDFHDADWSDITESQLEELVLSSLDTIFKSAIKRIVTCGYTEEVAMKAVLRSGLCYGCKDTVSNIVDNTLIYLRNGQEIDPSGDQYFEDLLQMEKYILAEMVCVLREVRPFFSTGDAMWCLLISDMNISHACAMDGEPFCSLAGDGLSNCCSSNAEESQLRKEAADNPPSPSKLNPSTLNPSTLCSHSCPLEAPMMASVPCVHHTIPEVPAATAESSHPKPKTPFILHGLASEKENANPTSRTLNKSFSLSGASQLPISDEKLGGSRKISGINKRDYILRQKSVHLEKSYRTYSSKGASRAGKLSSFGSLLLDKKIKSVSGSTGMSLKEASLQLSKAVGVGLSQDNGNNDLSTHIGLASPSACSVETGSSNAVSIISKASVLSTLPSNDAPAALSVADTELSLSLPAKSYSSPVAEVSNTSHNSTPPFDRSFGQWVPQDKKDEMIVKLIPKVRDLRNQLQEWTEWANQKVMQAARRLGKDKAELKTLRQEKEDVEKLKKEKQTLEENTMKKLSEMENALCKASGQVERANSAVRRLEVENANLRQEMEAAKLQAAESAASCQEVLKREKTMLMQFQSWEKQKALFLGDLTAERRNLMQLQQEVEVSKDQRDQLEACWRQEEKTKLDLLAQATSLRKEREELEAKAKSKEDMARLKADKTLQKYKNDIERLQKEISLLRLKTESSKIAALRGGVDGSYASRLADSKVAPPPETPAISKASREFLGYSGNGGVKRERECVMCLSEEMSVVFLPCVHQVVCTTCNELHEKQGMKDCPSCRAPIQRRISVRYTRS